MLPILLVMIAFVYAYFYSGGGWNQNSRFALTRSIVENRSLSIDAFHESTGDKSFRDGHYYSDKAPGLSLIAVPLYAVVQPILRSALGDQKSSKDALRYSTWILTFLTSGMATLLLAFFLFNWASKTMSEKEALFSMLTFAVATPACIQAQLFFGHSVASLFLFLTFYFSKKSLLKTGFFGAMAIMVEYPLAIPVLFLLFISVFSSSDRSFDRNQIAKRIAKNSAGIFAGSLAPLIVLALYQTVCFGSMFKTGYSFLAAGHEGMNQGWLGFNLPSLGVLWKLTFSPYRGLFYYSPILFIGLYYLMKDSKLRLGTIGLCVYAFLWNASYLFWEGGWSFEPRHLTWILPFLSIGAGLAFVKQPLLTALLFSYSTFVQFVVAATTPTPPSDLINPFTDLNLKLFQAGKLSVNPQHFDESATTLAAFFETAPAFAAGSNIGRLLGLSGLSQLWPLFFIVVIVFSYGAVADTQKSR